MANCVSGDSTQVADLMVLGGGAQRPRQLGSVAFLILRPDFDAKGNAGDSTQVADLMVLVTED